MPPRPRAPSSAANSIAAEMGAQGIPARGGSPPPPVTTKHEASGTGEAQSGPVRSPAPEGSDRPVEEKNSPAEIPWYDKLENIDEDYRKYLSCVRFVNGHQTVVVPEGGLDAEPVRVGDKSDGAGKKDGEEAASRATSGKNGCVVGKKEKGKGKVAAITTGGPALKSRLGDSTAHPQKGQKEKNNGRKNGAKKMKVAEKEENPSAEPHLETLNTASGKGKVAAITMGGPALMSRVRDSTLHHSVVEEEGKPLKELPVETLNTVKRKRKSTDVQNAESCTASGKEKVAVITTGEPALKSRVCDSTTHPQKVQKEKNGRKNGAKKMKVVEEEGKPSKELPVETLNTVKRKRKSSDVQNTESHTASELHGVVWPTHIMERPDSEFKEKLMRLLRKPFSQGEYDTLLDKATTRLPATKKRQTRGGVKYYNSKHERKPSYFDCHPDLAKQVRVESTSKPNQLSLLRGFFFWMKNIVHHDQFRPWRDDFKQYKVTMIEIE